MGGTGFRGEDEEIGFGHIKHGDAYRPSGVEVNIWILKSDVQRDGLVRSIHPPPVRERHTELCSWMRSQGTEWI